MINTGDAVDLSIGVDVAVWGDLVSGQVVVSDELLSWLVDIKAVWKLSSSQKKGEGVTAIVSMVNLTDLNGVISQVVVDDVWEAVVSGEETEYFAVVVQELLLGFNLTTTEGFLEELNHLSILLWWNWNLALGKVVLWAILVLWEVDSDFRLYR